MNIPIGQKISYSTIQPVKIQTISQNNVKQEQYLIQNQKHQHAQDVQNSQLQAPPQPKCKSKKYHAALKKIKQISDRYFLSLFKQDHDRIISKIALMDKLDNRTKVASQSAAVVLFFQYFDQIRTSSNRQFCTRNGLSTYIFNKSYKNYYNLFVKDKEHEEKRAINLGLAKKELIQDQGFIEPPTIKSKFTEINNITEAVSVIYDCLFKSNLYQINRREIIEKLVVHYQNLDMRITQQTNWIQQKGAQIYYIFFNILKALKSGIQFKYYKTAILKRTGVEIDKENQSQVTKIYNDYQSGPIQTQSYEQATFHSSDSP